MTFYSEQVVAQEDPVNFYSDQEVAQGDQIKKISVIRWLHRVIRGNLQ